MSRRLSKVLSFSAHEVSAEFGRSASSSRKLLQGDTIDSLADGGSALSYNGVILSRTRLLGGTIDPETATPLL